ncbi:hypothetical protein [Aureivirga sp. CE67]|uniref:hypothetical protein n=1 Tax=Aureivirga sp. CE67 TaxID=1788983 RepID=UPI0018CA1177|nr:hypothetical protein [Aureivirga sp. CE67]
MNIVCFDIGTTNLKVVSILNDKSLKKTFTTTNPEKIIDVFCAEIHFDKILITGTGSNKIEKKGNYIFINELEASAHIAKTKSLDSCIIVNIGTGTSFVKYEKGETTHLIGTGIGGGTLLGLSQRLLGTNSSFEIEKLAENGNLNEINITANDLFEESFSFLKGDITISNFAKNSTETNNLAIGICSLVAEPIVSILKAHLENMDSKKVLFCGGTTENQSIRLILEKYSKLFEFDYHFLEDPIYGTCLGAISLCQSK